MNPPDPERQGGLAPALTVALILLAVNTAVNLSGGYGYFRDEFYYIACSERLAWGYVDHPPLSILLLRLNRLLFGDSIAALRLLPALASSASVLLTGLFVRDLGGGRMAQLVACTAAAVAPVYLGVGSFYSMNAFEILFWTASAWLVVKLIDGGDPRLWAAWGILVGLGFQNKLGMLFMAAATVGGLLLSPQRVLLAGRWFWIGSAAAAMLALPNLAWQAANGWPTLEFMRNAQQWKNAPLSPGAFLSAQILFQHPLAVPLWTVGVAALLFAKSLRRFRFLAVAFLLLLLLFILQRGKPYYISPAYPALLAAGAVALERVAGRWTIRWPLPAYAALLAAGGLVTLPLGLPVLPPETYLRYSEALGMRPPAMERGHDQPLPQIFADRFGWEEMVAEVARVYESLNPEERADAAIHTQNYGEAGAVDFFGPRYGLPRAISGHNSYWLWGPRGHSGRVVIIVGGRKEDHEKVFSNVEIAAVHRHPYAMPFEADLPIFLCREIRLPFDKVWPRVKLYI